MTKISESNHAHFDESEKIKTNVIIQVWKDSQVVDRNGDIARDTQAFTSNGEKKFEIDENNGYFRLHRHRHVSLSKRTIRCDCGFYFFHFFSFVFASFFMPSVYSARSVVCCCSFNCPKYLFTHVKAFYILSTETYTKKRKKKNV